MAGGIWSYIVDRNIEYLNFNLWLLWQMLLEIPQKWQTRTYLGISVFLKWDLVTCFGSCPSKEQFGQI